LRPEPHSARKKAAIRKAAISLISLGQAGSPAGTDGIVALERHEFAARKRAGEQAVLLERSPVVVAAAPHEGRDLHSRQ
jgi:hypothetical protein